MFMKNRIPCVLILAHFFLREIMGLIFAHTLCTKIKHMQNLRVVNHVISFVDFQNYLLFVSFIRIFNEPAGFDCYVFVIVIFVFFFFSFPILLHGDIQKNNLMSMSIVFTRSQYEQCKDSKHQVINNYINRISTSELSYIILIRHSAMLSFKFYFLRYSIACKPKGRP